VIQAAREFYGAVFFVDEMGDWGFDFKEQLIAALPELGGVGMLNAMAVARYYSNSGLLRRHP
jgi:hypothetical protein